MCGTHHRAVHEGGITVGRTEEGGFAFCTADGRLIRAVPPQPVRTVPLEQLIAPVHRPPAVGPATLAGWSGERLHLDEVVSELRRRQTSRATAA